MAKLIVKPTINFLSTLPDFKLVDEVRSILRALTNNSSYPNPNPALSVVSDAVDVFEKAIMAAANGGTVLTLTKNLRRTELVALVRLLAIYVAGECKGDLIILISSGFPIHKPTRNAIGALARPGTPILKRGRLPGELWARTKPIHGVFIYNWRVVLTTDPDVVVQTAQSTGARVLFTGLIPGQTYRVLVNAVGAAGPTAYSNPGFLMVA